MGTPLTAKKRLFLFWFGIPFAILNVNDAEAGVCLVYTDVFAVQI
jgi:hypothetical protein